MSRLIEGLDYVVRLLDLKTSRVDGCVVNTLDCPTVIINERISRKRQKAALKHELYHLEHDDLYNDVDDVESIEGRNPY